MYEEKRRGKALPVAEIQNKQSYIAGRRSKDSGSLLFRCAFPEESFLNYKITALYEITVTMRRFSLGAEACTTCHTGCTGKIQG